MVLAMGFAASPPSTSAGTKSQKIRDSRNAQAVPYLLAGDLPERQVSILTRDGLTLCDHKSILT
jgi:hypothetical protein